MSLYPQLILLLSPSSLPGNRWYPTPSMWRVFLCIQPLSQSTVLLRLAPIVGDVVAHYVHFLNLFIVNGHFLLFLLQANL